MGRQFSKCTPVQLDQQQKYSTPFSIEILGILIEILGFLFEVLGNLKICGNLIPYVSAILSYINTFKFQQLVS